MGSTFRRLEYAFRPVTNQTDFLLEDLPVFVTFLLCLFLFVALTMFFGFHMNLVLNAMTTIELREKKNNEDPYIKHRFYVAHIKFDRGKWGTSCTSSVHGTHGCFLFTLGEMEHTRK
mmetsp:Transcript_14903/g.28367  ORF Transcript_14903/g.28367 Transcript_14903/m.28367 type:complete len:117 (-) Transcript_14903:284-634(-)